MAALQQRGLDGGSVGGERGAFADPRRCFAQAHLEVRDRGAERPVLLLEQRGGEERVVHLLAQAVERCADARLRLGELRPFDVEPGVQRRVEDALVDAKRCIVGVLRRREQRLAARQRQRRRRHVALILHLTEHRHRRQPFGLNRAQPERGVRFVKLQLAHPGIRVQCLLLQRAELQGLTSRLGRLRAHDGGVRGQEPRQCKR